MDSNMDALTKLASELTDRVEELEKQNEQLCAENKTLKEAQVKQALQPWSRKRSRPRPASCW